MKTTEQIIAELEALAPRARIAFIVDDNLIGNKQAIKDVLREVVAWQDDTAIRSRSLPRRRSIWPTTRNC